MSGNFAILSVGNSKLVTRSNQIRLNLNININMKNISINTRSLCKDRVIGNEKLIYVAKSITSFPAAYLGLSRN